jgi:hypothetical protein
VEDAHTGSEKSDAINEDLGVEDGSGKDNLNTKEELNGDRGDDKVMAVLKTLGQGLEASQTWVIEENSSVSLLAACFVDAGRTVIEYHPGRVE